MAPKFTNKFVSSFLLLLSLFNLSGCFSRWNTTEKDVRRYLGTISYPLTYHTIECDSMKLYCVASGPDTLPPLLLIHGAPGSWYDLRNMLEDTALRRRFQIIVVDRPGYGESQKRSLGGPSAVSSIDQQAYRISKALSINHSGQPAVVVGRSYGGPIAARVAMLNPKKVRHLVMVAPPVDPSLERFYWFSKWGNFKPVRLFLPRAFNTATDEKFDHISQLEKLSAHWPLLGMPVSVLQGGNDWVVDPANLNYLRNQLRHPAAEFIYLPEAGHAITETHPDLVRDLILGVSQARMPSSETLLSGTFRKE